MSIVLVGSTSGSVTLQEPAVAGTTVIDLPATSGTMVVTGGAQTVQFAAGSASTPSITFTGDTNTGIFSPGADTIAFTEGGTESMRITSSGNVCIGTTTTPNQQAVIYRTSATTSNGALLLDGNGSYAGLQFAVSGTLQGSISSDLAALYITHEDVIAFNTGGSGNVGGSERMRINSAGQIAWGTSSIDGYLTLTWAGQTYVGFVMNNTDAFGTSANIRFKNNGTLVGEISSSTTATNYVTSSDYRLKENVVPMTGALTKVAQLKPCTYTWKSTGEASQGFIAHELQAVVPDCVTGEKDAVETYIDEDGNEQTRIKPQGVDTSFLVATLTAAIQEQQAIITDLKARIETLENK